jgi:hypothetical protein
VRLLVDWLQAVLLLAESANEEGVVVGGAERSAKGGAESVADDAREAGASGGGPSGGGGVGSSEDDCPGSAVTAPAERTLSELWQEAVLDEAAIEDIDGDAALTAESSSSRDQRSRRLELCVLSTDSPRAAITLRTRGFAPPLC